MCATPNYQVLHTAEMEARPTYSLNVFFTLFCYFFNRTRKTIKRQVSQFQRHLQTFYAPLRDNSSCERERERAIVWESEKYGARASTSKAH